MRIYNPSLGRFLSVDPLKMEFPWYSPYHFAGNSPIRNVDIDGAEPGSVVESWPGFSEGGQHFKVDGYYVYTSRQSMNPELDRFYYWNEKNGAWEQFTPRTMEDVSKQRASALYALADAGQKFAAGTAVAIVAAPLLLETGLGTFIVKEAAEEGFEQLTGIPVVIDPFDIAEKFAKGVFKDAAAKELKNFLKQNAKESIDVVKNRLTKAIKSHEKEIFKHEDWIANPKSKYGDAWDGFSDTKKGNILHHWKEDIKRHKAYKDAKQGALDELK